MWCSLKLAPHSNKCSVTILQGIQSRFCLSPCGCCPGPPSSSHSANRLTVNSQMAAGFDVEGCLSLCGPMKAICPAGNPTFPLRPPGRTSSPPTDLQRVLRAATENRQVDFLLSKFLSGFVMNSSGKQRHIKPPGQHQQNHSAH